MALVKRGPGRRPHSRGRRAATWHVLSTCCVLDINSEQTGSWELTAAQPAAWEEVGWGRTARASACGGWEDLTSAETPMVSSGVLEVLSCSSARVAL